VVESRAGQPQLDHRLNTKAACAAAKDAVLIAVLTFTVFVSDACKHFDSEAVIDELGMCMHNTIHHPDSNWTASTKQHVPDIAAIFPLNVPSDVAREFTMPHQQRLAGFLFARMILMAGLLLIGLPSEQVVAELPSASPSQVHFQTDIVPILTRLGCNGGGCHGKATGQNGFRLSLLGFEPDLDYLSLVQEARGRRLFPAEPSRSLLLMKATGQTPHGGGRRLDETSEDYRLLHAWIAQGAKGPQADDPTVKQIVVSPAEAILAPHTTQSLTVTATFSDGSVRDVTRQAIYQTNASELATVSLEGQVQTSGQPGLVAIMARFCDQIATFHAVVPVQLTAAQQQQVQEQLNQLEQQFAHSRVDQLMLKQWRRLGVVPSAPADDATFVRRATLDICGTLPTAQEVAEYQADSRPEKRARLIDRLLERSEYASYFALKWADILQNRGAGYSTSKQRPGTTLFANWIRDSLASNKPYDQFVAEIITASGSQNENPPTVWYRTVRKPTEYVESVAQAFLGVRIQCAQCHHHPTENWSQADYFSLAAVFGRVGRKGGFADAEVPTNEMIYLAERGEIVHPRTGQVLPPRPLGDEPFALTHGEDPRLQLAAWLAQPDNPFLARTLVNRLWSHFMGRGLIHPVDDARSTNPPSNPELLEMLSNAFISSQFDIKQVIRLITTSHAYGLEATPHAGNQGDTQTFSRYYARRLSAEVLLDAMSQVLEVPTEFPGLPAGTRAIDLPDENVAARFLDVFGRPARQSACECERVDAPALHQALELVNSTELQRKLTAANGYATRLANQASPHESRIEEAFVRCLARPPRADERQAAVEFIAAEADPVEAYRSLLLSLLATTEFLFNH